MLQTKYGSVKCVLTDGHHVYLSGTLTVRNIEVNVNAHLFLIDNEWKFKNYSDLYLSRSEWGKSVSNSCHKAIYQELILQWSSWIASHPLALDLAEKASKSEKYQNLSEELRELEVKVAELKALIADLVIYDGCEFELEEYMENENYVMNTKTKHEAQKFLSKVS